MAHNQVSAIILAAGESNRLHTNKLLLLYNGKPLIEHLFDLIALCDFHEIILVISKRNLTQLQKFEYTSTDGVSRRIHILAHIKIRLNDHVEMGQSYSVVNGTQVATGDGYLFFTVDQPLLTTKLINEILRSGNSRNIVYPLYQGQPCTPTYFGCEFREDLLHVKGQQGGRSVRDLYTFACLGVQVEDESQLQDIDTLEDYRNIINQCELDR